jgi:hypothetical protein
VAKKRKKAAKKARAKKSVRKGAKRKKAKAVKRKVKRKKGRRTVMRSSAGKKLYAVRDAEGKFKDIQTYARAHAADIARDAADEV